jgi:hypothetical protein
MGCLEELGTLQHGFFVNCSRYIVIQNWLVWLAEQFHGDDQIRMDQMNAANDFQLGQVIRITVMTFPNKYDLLVEQLWHQGIERGQCVQVEGSAAGGFFMGRRSVKASGSEQGTDQAKQDEALH